jgi:hypothetical protein
MIVRHAPSSASRHVRSQFARLAMCVTSAFVLALPQVALAQGKGPLTIGEVTIIGRVQKPVAAVDVSKIQPKLTLAELRQPFLDRIEEAARKDPF